MWNGKHRTVSIPDEKRIQRISQIETYLQLTTHSYSETEKMVGRLSHLTAVLPQMKCYLVVIYRWLAEWVHRVAKRDTPAPVLEDLDEWLAVLSSVQPTRLIPDHDIRNIGWVGDASTGYGIGVIVGKRWSQLYLYGDWDTVDVDGIKREIAWLETAAVRIGFQMVRYLQQQIKGKRFLVLSDNTVTEAVIRNKRSRNKYVNEQWKILQQELIAAETELFQVHVISADNAADELSRGLRGNKRFSDQLCLPVPDDLKPFLKHERY